MARPYYKPTFDPVFKHIMSFDDLRNEFISCVIGEQVINSKVTDEHLNPLNLYKELRELVNAKQIQELMEELGNDTDALAENGNLSNLQQRSLAFTQKLAPIFYQLQLSLPKTEKNARIDVFCETEHSIIDIEVQIIPQDFWDMRILYHICNMFARQFSKGLSWHDPSSFKDAKIRKVIGISLLSKPPKGDEMLMDQFPWYKVHPWKEDELKREFKLRDSENHNIIRPGIEMYDFNLSAFNVLRQRHGLDDRPETLVEWLDFFTNADKKRKQDIKHIKSKAVRKAYNIVDRLPPEVEKEAGKFVVQLNNISNYVRATKEEGREEGREEGIGIGIETKQKEIILNMLQKGMDIESIAELTNTDADYIKYIKENIGNP